MFLKCKVLQLPDGGLAPQANLIYFVPPQIFRAHGTLVCVYETACTRVCVCDMLCVSVCVYITPYETACTGVCVRDMLCVSVCVYITPYETACTGSVHIKSFP